MCYVSVESRLSELMQLPENWDSYGGKPVSEEVVRWLRQIMNQMPRWRGEEPSISPTNAGGLVMSFANDGYEVDIGVEPDGSVSLYVGNGSDWEWESEYKSVDDFIDGSAVATQ